MDVSYRTVFMSQKDFVLLLFKLYILGQWSLEAIGSGILAYLTVDIYLNGIWHLLSEFTYKLKFALWFVI